MFAANAETTAPHDLVAAAQRLRQAAHHGDGAPQLFDSLADLEDDVLSVLQGDRHAAAAFWLNVHGALVERGRRGGVEACRVADVDLTAEAVKHDILRADRWKYGFGYLPDPFPGRFSRRHRLGALDERVHFATLAARHVPEMAVTFTAANVDDELRTLTRQYLREAADYDPESGVARVPRVCLWYRGDFGGRGGLRSLLVTHDILPPDARPRFRYVVSLASGDPDAPAERARGDTQ